MAAGGGTKRMFRPGGRLWRFVNRDNNMLLSVYDDQVCGWHEDGGSNGSNKRQMWRSFVVDYVGQNPVFIFVNEYTQKHLEYSEKDGKALLGTESGKKEALWLLLYWKGENSDIDDNYFVSNSKMDLRLDLAGDMPSGQKLPDGTVVQIRSQSQKASQCWKYKELRNLKWEG